jgi:RNA polymerase sigma factor (sigma-70 family)
LEAMQSSTTATVPTTDAALVERTRAGDDGAFAELYRRYQPRIAAFVRRLLRDETRAEDVTREAFISALRRLRQTDSTIIFKPWIYEIARNAAIDAYRRASRGQEVPIGEDESLSPPDRLRLSAQEGPDAALMKNQRFENLRGALDELPDSHHRILVLRELEGLSYREIGERMELTRPAVESTLFRARRRLEREYQELDTGRRCEAMWALAGRLAAGEEARGEWATLRRHARRCSSCRRRARELGLELWPARRAALALLPGFLRRRLTRASGGAAAAGKGSAGAGPLLPLGAALGEKAAVVGVVAALAGVGGAAVGHLGPFASHPRATPQHQVPVHVKRGADERRAGERRAHSGQHSARPKPARARSSRLLDRGSTRPAPAQPGTQAAPAAKPATSSSGAAPASGQSGSSAPSAPSPQSLLQAVPKPQLPATSGSGSVLPPSSPNLSSVTGTVGKVESSAGAGVKVNVPTQTVPQVTTPLTGSTSGGDPLSGVTPP